MAESGRQAFWKRLLREVEQGSSVREVAVRHGVNARTLAWWCSRLRREAPVSLLPVVVRGAEMGRPALVEVRVSDVVVCVEQGTDVSYVAALVAALRRC